MNIPVNTEDMMHICGLLYEDVECCRGVLRERPNNREALEALARSQSIMRKVAKQVLITYEPTPMETRPDLN